MRHFVFSSRFCASLASFSLMRRRSHEGIRLDRPPLRLALVLSKAGMIARDTPSCRNDKRRDNSSCNTKIWLRFSTARDGAILHRPPPICSRNVAAHRPLHQAFVPFRPQIYFVDPCPPVDSKGGSTHQVYAAAVVRILVVGAERDISDWRQ